MKLLASIDPQDRKLLLFCLSAAVVVALITALFAREEDKDKNPVPGTYLTGRQGARAAFELLQSNGYAIERWEQPLGELSDRADANTVLILAEPGFVTLQDRKAISDVLDRGGRVIATGFAGSSLLPDGAARPSEQLQTGACKLTPEGMDELAGSGEVWMAPSVSWTLSSPSYRVQYNCADAPAVVEYSQGKGHVEWWASATPLENGSISRGQSLEFFLNSLGPRDGHHFYWDESLHTAPVSEWYYARGPALNLLLMGLAALGLLTFLSFGRRSGPVRDLPLPGAAPPVEFLDALGSLYQKAGASSTAVVLAYERFRRKTGAMCGQNGLIKNARELAEMLRMRFPGADASLENDLAACEAGAQNESLSPKEALALVQAIDSHFKYLCAAASNADENIRKPERARRAG